MFYSKCDWKQSKVAITRHQQQFTSTIYSNFEPWVHKNHTSDVLFKSSLSHQANKLELLAQSVKAPWFSIHEKEPDLKIEYGRWTDVDSLNA